jgi:hypothetical protein
LWFVLQEIKRDIKDPPQRKPYTFPTEYAATQPYEILLQDVQPAWTRETGILTGKLTPGVGTDFPGDVGAEDHSGLLTTTRNKPVPPEEGRCLTRAVYESSAEEYEDPPGFVDPLDRTEDDEDAAEEDEGAAAEGMDGHEGAWVDGCVGGCGGPGLARRACACCRG